MSDRATDDANVKQAQAGIKEIEDVHLPAAKAEYQRLLAAYKAAHGEFTLDGGRIHGGKGDSLRISPKRTG